MRASLPLSIALAALLAPAAARACAACACGDPTLTVMGAGEAGPGKSYAGRLRLSAEWRRRTEAVPDPFGTARVVEDRWSLGLAWAPLDAVQLAATLPLVDRTLERPTLARDRALHVGDAELLARWFALGARGRAPHQLGLTAGLRLPTGPELTGADGAPLPLDAQPGNGAWMPSLGAWYGAFAHPWSGHVSATLVHPFEGHGGFAPGLAGLATAFGQYQWGADLAARLGADARLTGRDHQDGAAIADSGGPTLFALVGLAYSPIIDTLLHATLRWPMLDARRGGERAEPSFSLGVTHDL